ncbi:MAG: hypothetical protein ABSE51_13775 [Terracidiphilus sp.]
MCGVGGDQVYSFAGRPAKKDSRNQSVVVLFAISGDIAGLLAGMLIVFNNLTNIAFTLIEAILNKFSPVLARNAVARLCTA